MGPVGCVTISVLKVDSYHLLSFERFKSFFSLLHCSLLTNSTLILIYCQRYGSNVSHSGLSIIPILTLLIILLVGTVNSNNNAFAPPFGGFHPEFKPPEITKPPEISTQPEIRSPEAGEVNPGIQHGSIENLPNKILEATITTEILVHPTDSHDVQMQKMNEVFQLLDQNTQSLELHLRDTIWKDAYTFANTVIKPVMHNIVAKFLLNYLMHI